MTEATLEEQRMARLEALIGHFNAHADLDVRARAQELVQAVLEMHREPLEKLAASLQDGGRLRELSADAGVRSVLLLHGLHPVPLEERVQEALERARPTLDAHGGTIEALTVVAGVVRMRLLGSCDGCKSSSTTVQTIEAAIYDAAPDVVSVQIEVGETNELVTLGPARGAERRTHA